MKHPWLDVESALTESFRDAFARELSQAIIRDYTQLTTTRRKLVTTW